MRRWTLRQRMERIERAIISDELVRQPNLCAVAKALGISRPTLYNRMQKFNLVSARRWGRSVATLRAPIIEIPKMDM